MSIAAYRIGPPTRPNITHDNGFLDKFKPRAPTIADRSRYTLWQSKLELAEAGQDVPFVPHNDIPDALGAYRHFLNGSGRNRNFSYERYVKYDTSGVTTLANMIVEVKQAAFELYERGQAGKDADFDFTGGALSAGNASTRFPYPATENWQKAIGAHNFWISGDAKVAGAGKLPALAEFDVQFTVHVEDMYNFNPGAADIATGIPDEDNGVFEITGLAKQYLNVSTLTRRITWTGRPGAGHSVEATNDRRQREPSDNRRTRNRA